MSVSELDSKRTTKDQLVRILESKNFIVAYERNDGSIGTLCTVDMVDSSFMLNILEYLYVTSPIAMSATHLED